jgi:hypothetical protein
MAPKDARLAALRQTIAPRVFDVVEKLVLSSSTR